MSAAGGASTGHPYDALTPERVLDAVETCGVRCDGRQLALNSYENRVYQVGLEEGDPLIAKFYRPGRWSDAAILEEHRFSAQLAAEEVPAVPPLVVGGGTLFTFAGFRFALYPKRPGRTPELEDPDTLRQMGRLMARIHNVGALEAYVERPELNVEGFGVEPSRYVLDHGLVAPHVESSYRALVEECLQRVRRCQERAGDVTRLRLHGDCHPGNVLWSQEGPHFVDFDDSRSGPAVQDLWMLLSGDRESMALQLAHVLKGYGQFREFNPRELHLVESLRTLRMIHYSGWLARRWDDPTFPAHFPWFDSPRYWEQQILALREQIAAMDDPPLAMPRLD